MNRREKIATLLGLFADGFSRPSDLEPETRTLLGLPENLPSGGYGVDDTRICAVETLARILSENF